MIVTDSDIVLLRLRQYRAAKRRLYAEEQCGIDWGLRWRLAKERDAAARQYIAALRTLWQ